MERGGREAGRECRQIFVFTHQDEIAKKRVTIILNWSLLVLLLLFLSKLHSTVLWVTLEDPLHTVTCGDLRRMRDKKWGTRRRETLRQQTVYFFTKLKDFTCRKCGDICFLLQSSTYSISPSIRDVQENVVACRSRLLSAQSSKRPGTRSDTGRERDGETDFLHVFTCHAQIYMIYSASSNNLFESLFLSV